MLGVFCLTCAMFVALCCLLSQTSLISVCVCQTCNMFTGHDGKLRLPCVFKVHAHVGRQRLHGMCCCSPSSRSSGQGDHVVTWAVRYKKWYKNTNIRTVEASPTLAGFLEWTCRTLLYLGTQVKKKEETLTSCDSQTS